jgi:hypothetical protein
MNDTQDKHPSLFDLWSHHQFLPDLFAHEAKVSVDAVQAMLGNKPATKEDAEKVLSTLSVLYHQEYTLETVYVPIRDEEENDDANTRESE